MKRILLLLPIVLLVTIVNSQPINFDYQDTIVNSNEIQNALPINDFEKNLIKKIKKEEEELKASMNWGVHNTQKPINPYEDNKNSRYKEYYEEGLTIEKARDLSGSSDPDIRKMAVDYLYEQKAKDPIVKSQAGFTNYVKAQEGQEEFAGGVFGFDPYKTVQENREYYARMGYTMSYKYRDSDLYKYFGISAAILLLIVIVISRQKNFQNVTNNPK